MRQADSVSLNSREKAAEFLEHHACDGNTHSCSLKKVNQNLTIMTAFGSIMLMDGSVP